VTTAPRCLLPACSYAFVSWDGLFQHTVVTPRVTVRDSIPPYAAAPATYNSRPPRRSPAAALRINAPRFGRTSCLATTATSAFAFSRNCVGFSRERDYAWPANTVPSCCGVAACAARLPPTPQHVYGTLLSTIVSYPARSTFAFSPHLTEKKNANALRNAPSRQRPRLPPPCIYWFGDISPPPGRAAGCQNISPRAKHHPPLTYSPVVACLPDISNLRSHEHLPTPPPSRMACRYVRALPYTGACRQTRLPVAASFL